MHKFESGYNGIPWSRRASYEDTFYCELDTCAKSKTFNEEIINAVTSKDLILVDNDSLIAQAVRPYFRDSNIVNVEEISFEAGFKEELEQEYGIYNPQDQVLLWTAHRIKRPVCFPIASGRILNLNYRRVSQQELGNPYFVFIESERMHKLKLVAKDLHLHVEADLLKITPEVFRSYILHKLHLEMFSSKNFPYPHNDLVERKIWASLNPEIHNLYNTSETGNSDDGAYSHFPIHGMVKKYFHVDLKVNSCEAELYGQAY